MIELFSIVIPCQEDGFLLVPTIESIFRTSLPERGFEIVLIRSENVQIPKDIFRFPIRQYSGFFESQAQAISLGIKKASGDIICMTKPGCIVAEDWLEQIEHTFKCSPAIDGVGGPVLPSSAFGTRIQKLASRIFYEEQNFPDSIVVPRLGSFRGLLHATNSAYRKNILVAIRLDETLAFDYDFDLCWTVLSRGGKVYFNPKMKVKCIFPSTLGRILRRYYIWGSDYAKIKRKYADKHARANLKILLYPYYTMIRSIFDPSAVFSEKWALRFVQHLAFCLGCNFGYFR